MKMIFSVTVFFCLHLFLTASAIAIQEPNDLDFDILAEDSSPRTISDNQDLSEELLGEKQVNDLDSDILAEDRSPYPMSSEPEELEIAVMFSEIREQLVNIGFIDFFYKCFAFYCSLDCARDCFLNSSQYCSLCKKVPNGKLADIEKHLAFYYIQELRIFVDSYCPACDAGYYDYPTRAPEYYDGFFKAPKYTFDL